MSFQDLESGRTIGRIFQDPTQAVVSGIFQINTAVSTFQRLVNTLGTLKDTANLRVKIHKTRLHIGELVKNTDIAIKNITDAKLAKDFQAVKKEFHKAQRLAAEKETTYTTPQENLSYGGSERYYSEHAALVVDSKRQEVVLDMMSSDIYGGSERYYSEHAALLVDSKRQEKVLLDNEIAFNKAREHGIQEIQNQIIEVNEIFKDVVVIVQEQGIVIDDIGSNTENVQAAIGKGRSQLAKAAAKTKKTNSSLACLLFFIFGIVLMIIVIILLAA